MAGCRRRQADRQLLGPPAQPSPAPSPGAAPEDLPAPAAATTSPTALSGPWSVSAGSTSVCLSVCPPLGLFPSLSLSASPLNLCLCLSLALTLTPGKTASQGVPIRCCLDSTVTRTSPVSHTASPSITHALPPCHPTPSGSPHHSDPCRHTASHAQPLTQGRTVPHCVTRYRHRFSQMICAQHTISHRAPVPWSLKMPHTVSPSQALGEGASSPVTSRTTTVRYTFSG